MRDWISASGPDREGVERPSSPEQEVFSQLFPSRSAAPSPERGRRAEHAAHPPAEALHAYVTGKLLPDWPDPDGWEEIPWGYRKICVHLLECDRCRTRVQALSFPTETETKASRRRRQAISLLPAWRRWWQRWRAEIRQPVPQPARVTIAVQSLAIVGLVGLLLWQAPPSLWRAGRPLPPASSFPSSPSPSPSESTVDPRAATAEEPPPGGVPTPMATGSTGNGLEGERDPSLLSYPPEVQRAIETLETVADPNVRLRSLRLIQRYPDPLLVEPLSRIYERESHPQVREEIARTIFLFISRTDRGLSSAVRMLRWGREHTPELPWFQQLERELAEMQRLLSERLQVRIEVYSQPMLRCAAPQDLTLGKLLRIVSDLDGTVVLDRSLADQRFRVQLPSVGERARALRHLKGLGIACEE